MPGMNWNGDADRALLLAILKTQDVKIDFDAVAQELTTEATTCTPRAVQERLKKLKRMAQEGGSAGNGDESGSGSSQPKPKSTPRKKTADGAADGESPLKKRKTPNKKKDQAESETVKKERDNEED
ncbi:hypothetical protein H2203_003491 [Taxawa tesnikishii (nom. ined.)]|nr:hypothetical protein H2203_003491 [Dothideales sp. JES 119]